MSVEVVAQRFAVTGLALAVHTHAWCIVGNSIEPFTGVKVVLACLFLDGWTLVQPAWRVHHDIIQQSSRPRGRINLLLHATCSFDSRL